MQRYSSSGGSEALAGIDDAAIGYSRLGVPNAHFSLLPPKARKTPIVSRRSDE
jgi:hypothetical protein